MSRINDEFKNKIKPDGILRVNIRDELKEIEYYTDKDNINWYCAAQILALISYKKADTMLSKISEDNKGTAFVYRDLVNLAGIKELLKVGRLKDKDILMSLIDAIKNQDTTPTEVEEIIEDDDREYTSIFTTYGDTSHKIISALSEGYFTLNQYCAINNIDPNTINGDSIKTTLLGVCLEKNIYLSVAVGREEILYPYHIIDNYFVNKNKGGK